VAFLSVGTHRLRFIRSSVERLPAFRSPRRCTITPPLSRFESRAMYFPYAIGSLKGSVKEVLTRMAKFVFFVLRSA